MSWDPDEGLGCYGWKQKAPHFPYVEWETYAKRGPSTRGTYDNNPGQHFCSPSLILQELIYIEGTLFAVPGIEENT